MKKITTIFYSLILLLLISCTNQDAVIPKPPVVNHEHEYINKIEDEKYLKQEANCEIKASYYYSCPCGELGKETFEVGTYYHQYEQIERVEPTYFDAGANIFKCVHCDNLKREPIPKLDYPTTSFDTSSIDHIQMNSYYYFDGIVISLDPFIIKNQYDEMIYLPIQDSKYALNDFLVVYASFTDFENIGSDYTVVQHNLDIYYVEEPEYSLSLYTISSGSYSTGNYGEFRTEGYTFSYNRTYQDKIIGNRGMNYDAYPGFIKNTTGFKDIAAIEITYKSDYPFFVGGSEDYEHYSYQEIEESFDYAKVKVNLYNSDFFIIEARDGDVYIDSLVIYYYDTQKVNYQEKNSGENHYALNVSSFDGTLVDGVSTVTYPVKVKYDDNGYEVIEYRSYTYTSFEYVSEHLELVNTQAMIDPIDVINYYVAFQTVPANYAKSRDYSENFKVFNTLSRQYSIYSRTNGYVLYVPFNGGSYIEFDIDLDGSYVNEVGKVTRGVGRVVVFMEGFSGSNYNDIPRAVLTTDHYITFREYYNDGTFSPRFNAEGHFTCYIQSAPTLYNYKKEEE